MRTKKQQLFKRAYGIFRKGRMVPDEIGGRYGYDILWACQYARLWIPAHSIYEGFTTL